MTGGDFLFELEKKTSLEASHPTTQCCWNHDLYFFVHFSQDVILLGVGKFRTAGPIPSPARVGYVGISSKGFQDPRMSYHESAKDFMDPAVSWHDFCTRRSSANQQK